MIRTLRFSRLPYRPIGRASLAIAALAAVSACSVLPGGGDQAATDAQIAAAPSVEGVPPPETASQAWRMRFADALHAKHPDKVFEGIPPNPLYAIIVLEIQIDGSGRVRNVRDMRTPRHATKERQAAMAAVRAGAPYPAPPAAMLDRSGVVKFTETWLFDNARKFRLRSLSVPQDPNALE